MKNIKLIFTGVLTGLANGIFGSGGGTIIVPFMEKLMNIKAHKAHATAIAVILPLSIISAVIYMFNMEIAIKETIFISLGGIIGGIIGAKFLNKIPSRILHIVFGVFMIVAAVKMILW